MGAIKASEAAKRRLFKPATEPQSNDGKRKTNEGVINSLLDKLFLFRALLAHSFWNVLREKLKRFLWYLSTGLFGVVALLFVAHSFVLWMVLLMTNVEGDIVGNFLRLVTLIADVIIVLIGAVYIDARRKGEI
jgi:hypothetical protein